MNASNSAPVTAGSSPGARGGWLRAWSVAAGGVLACTAVLAQPPAPAAVPASASAPLATIEQKCAPLASPGLRPATGQHLAKSPPAMAYPAKGVPFIDNVYGTCVVRMTEHDKEPPKGYARNDYSRRQPFNADDSRFLVSAQDGTWHLYDARTAEYVSQLRGLAGDAEPQWHPTNPDLLYYLPNSGIGMTLMSINVRTGESRQVADFSTRLKALWPSAGSAWTRSEGSPSADGRYWAFLVDSTDWQGLGLFTYDLAENRILAAYDLKSHGKGRPDHLSMSLSGKYVVVSWLDGPTAFTRDFKQPLKLQAKSEHSDLALTEDGDDAYVAIDYDSGGGPVFMTNLRTGVRTNLFDTYVRKTATALHVSGRASKRPGWVLVSTYGEGGAGGQQWLHGKLLAVQLKANPAIHNLGFHRSVRNGGWTSPVASVNRDFTRVAFNSNWGNGSATDINAYLMVLPPSMLR